VPPAGFLGVLLDMLGGKLAHASEEDKQHARVLVAVTLGGLSLPDDRVLGSEIKICDLTDDRGRQMLPPLPAVAGSPEEIEEAFDAVAEGQSDLEALTDELAACADEEERAIAMLFFLDARFLPPGRRLLVHGLASRPELNGSNAVLAGPRPPGTLRYPVRVIGKGRFEGRWRRGGCEVAAMLLRPRNLRLLGDGDDDADEDMD
tara:strand:+ start:179 stop:790 length:612 start_codon:yes stop_codon:yes gene_type:complete